MNCIIVLSSVTYAMKAARILNTDGIRADPVRSPETKKVRGCGYGVSVIGDCEKAEEIIRRNGINIIGTVKK